LLAAHGVREYWIVDADTARIEIRRLVGERFALAQTATGPDEVQSPLLPDLKLCPNDLLPTLQH
jgi:Uma2 family endonuclease